jgi:ACS family glucarate transporter-like MFS transporter
MSKQMDVSLEQVKRVGHHRYWVLGLIFIITVINYADRATMSIAGTSVVKELGLDPMMLGMIFSAFAWAYALGQIPGGWLLDRFGAKSLRHEPGAVVRVHYATGAPWAGSG